jgi:hypothetical protein
MRYMHMVAFGPVLVVPAGHAIQPRSAVADGCEVTICPLGQSVHGVQAVAPVVFAKEPLLHGVQAVAPIMFAKEPLLHGVQAVAFMTFVKEPALHAVHLASIVALPIVDTKDPGEHAVSVVHIEALSVVLNVPLAQGPQTGREAVPPVITKKPALQLHTLSCVEVPAPVCVCPIDVEHAVHGVQAVAPATALKVPLAHGSQSLSFVEIPGTERY